MDAQRLIGLANAHGIDLGYVAGAATQTGGIARQRDRTQIEKRLGIDVPKTVAGRQTRTYRHPDWSLAELAQAAAAGGVRGARWLAVRFSVAGDSSCADELWSSLAYHAQLIARRERWPMKVIGLDGRGQFYRDRLAALVLDDDAHRHYFAAAPALHAICMEVAPAEWDRSLCAPFRSLKSVYEGWLSQALAGIRRGLHSD